MLVLAAAILWPILISIASSAEGQIINALLGAICFVAALLFGLAVFTALKVVPPSTHQVPQGHAAVITKQRRRLDIVFGPGEVRLPLRDGEEITLEDLRDRHSDLQGEYTTLDNQRVKLGWQWICHIFDLARYLDQAAEPRAIVEGILQAKMLYHVARHTRKDLTGKLEEIAKAILIESRQQAIHYGIDVVVVSFTLVDIPGDPPKSPRPGEAKAERMRNLDAVVKEANPRTVLHIERLSKFGPSREQSSK